MTVFAAAQKIPEPKLLNFRSAKTHSDVTAWMGMVMFLGSWAVLFAALFFVYGALRSSALVWPPGEYPELPLGLPALNTALIALSSLVLHTGLKMVSTGRTRFLGPCLTLTALMGAGFLWSQLEVWQALDVLGLSPSSGSYGSTFFGLTWLHAAHVLVGVVALVYLALNAFRGCYTPALILPVRLWAMYWHFVGAVWALLFLTVYIL
jgi:cytochrome c oxidase subunit III